MRALPLWRVAFVALGFVACRDEASRVIPDTPLGRVARDWLAAHNRDEGHAIVHFTLENRGSAPVAGAQTDSIVRAGMRLADSLGYLVPVRTLQSSKSTLAVLLRSKDGATWTARFTPVRQPSLVKVAVEVNRTWIVRGAPGLPDSAAGQR